MRACQSSSKKVLYRAVSSPMNFRRRNGSTVMTNFIENMSYASWHSKFTHETKGESNGIIEARIAAVWYDRKKDLSNIGRIIEEKKVLECRGFSNKLVNGMLRCVYGADFRVFEVQSRNVSRINCHDHSSLERCYALFTMSKYVNY